LVSDAKPRTPKASSRTAQGASPGFKVQIAESPERAAQGVRSQLQINARHKGRLWYRDPLHRPFGASVVTVLVPRACALGFPESPRLVSRQKLANQAQLPNFCRKTGVFLQKRSKPCDPDSDSAAAKRPVSPRRHRGPFDCGLPLADFGFGINERLLYQDKPKSAIQRVLRAPPCTPCLRGE